MSNESIAEVTVPQSENLSNDSNEIETAISAEKLQYDSNTTETAASSEKLEDVLNASETNASPKKLPFDSNILETAASVEKMPNGSNVTETADRVSVFSENNQPPSYSSLDLITKLKSAKKESNTPAHFVGRACVIVCGSIVATICMIISLAIPIVIILHNYYLIN